MQTGIIFDSLERGGIFRQVLSKLFDAVALLVVIGTAGGILVLALQLGNSLDGASFSLRVVNHILASIWGVLVLAAIGYGHYKVFKHRASKVLQLPEGRVIPITSQLLRTWGEISAVGLLGMGLSPALAIFGREIMNVPNALLRQIFGYSSQFADYVVALLTWAIGVVVFSLAAVFVLAFAYMLAESVMLLVEIADNTRGKKNQE